MAELLLKNYNEVKKLFCDLVELLPINAVNKKNIMKALELSITSHKGQYRKGGGAYVIHPIRVAIFLIKKIKISDPVLIMAALCHDLLEDTVINYESLTGALGEEVAEIVTRVTRVEGEKRPSTGDLADSGYLARISEDKATVLLKLADKIDNLKDAIYHPDKNKRNVYCAEVSIAYKPLLKYLDEPCKAIVESELNKAVDAHKFSELIKTLMTCIDSVGFGGGNVNAPAACLDEVLQHVLLNNPGLKSWLVFDGNQLMAESGNASLRMIINIANTYITLINKEKTAEIVRILGMNERLASVNDGLWMRVANELKELSSLLEGLQNYQEYSSDYPWLQPLIGAEDNMQWWVLLILSVIYKRAAWIFPLWNASDMGVETAKEIQYLTAKDDKANKKWNSVLIFLLSQRESLFRFHQGDGSYNRYCKLVEEFQKNTQLDISSDILWSLRVTSEYLDAITDDHSEKSLQSIKNLFSEKWQLIMNGEKEDNGPVEFIQLTAVEELFENHDRGSQFRDLKIALSEYSKRISKSNNIYWIVFDSLEFNKRKILFKDNDTLNFVGVDSIDEFERQGIYLQQDFNNEGGLALKIFPARKYALLDRLPELTNQELLQIEAGRFEAVTIFDVLLKNKWKPGLANSEVIWVPRVYRILDSMEDLDPKNVQAINVKLDGNEGAVVFTAYLPLPSKPCKENEQEQILRKIIIARYLIAQINNFVITRRIYSIQMDVDLVNSPYGFLSHQELMDLIEKEDLTYKFKKNHGKYSQSFNFSRFDIAESLLVKNTISFDRSDIKRGTFLGVDIGGTYIKTGLFINGHNILALKRFDTFKKSWDNGVDIEIFCAYVVGEINTWLLGNGKSWGEIKAIGVSWPGAVKNNQIVCPSGTLRKLIINNKKINFDSCIDEVHSFSFLDVFRKAIEELLVAGDRSPILLLENDGNAEAFGNFCHYIRNDQSSMKESIIIKLGTSLAGARIGFDNAISDDVGEFAKLILNLNTKWLYAPGTVAREFVSSCGVRNLSRSMKIDGKPFFDDKEGENKEELPNTRIEAVELGALLTFWYKVSSTERANVLNCLCQSGNRLRISELNIIQSVVNCLKDNSEMLNAYIEKIGKEYFKRNSDNHISMDQWRLGLKRVYWLCQYNSDEMSKAQSNSIPEDFPYEALALKVISAVVIFSQLALHMAHTIAALYNIYGRYAFADVILAGGVLTGNTGSLVKRQSEAFLSKYYDKIYGDDKYLLRNALNIAKTGDDSDLIGPFGAAMLANRAYKVGCVQYMYKKGEYLVRNIPMGGYVVVSDFMTSLKDVGVCDVSEEDVREFLNKMVVDKRLLLLLSENKYQRVNC